MSANVGEVCMQLQIYYIMQTAAGAALMLVIAIFLRPLARSKTRANVWATTSAGQSVYLPYESQNVT